MLTLLSSIVAGLAFIGTHLWILFVGLVPSVLNFLSPVLEAVTKFISNAVSTLWQGCKDMTLYGWILTFVLCAGTYALGYHYGWQACIDWVHANFKLLGKTPAASWWKLW